MTNRQCENADCSKVVSDKVYDYSNSKFGMTLCFDCQKRHKSKAPQRNNYEGEPAQISEETVEDTPSSRTSVSHISSKDRVNYDPAFLGMVFNQSWENARKYEDDYDKAKEKFLEYFEEALMLAITTCRCRK